MVATPTKADAAELAKKDGHTLVMATAINAENLDVYAYIVASDAAANKLMNSLEKPGLNLESFGKVVLSGYGTRAEVVKHFEIIEAFKDGDYN